jgi:hypothetical protein
MPDPDLISLTRIIFLSNALSAVPSIHPEFPWLLSVFLSEKAGKCREYCGQF